MNDVMTWQDYLLVTFYIPLFISVAVLLAKAAWGEP